MPTVAPPLLTPDVQLVSGSARLTPNCGNLRMQFDAVVNGVLIRRCRFIDNQDGRTPWVSPPVETWTDEQGKRRYLPLCDFPPTVKPQLLTLARSVYEQFQKGGPA